ncbi:hypothetical protein J2Z76_000487 [Sedimentibacter acidaminivorans]|uniref:Uncharacterized protein n=1 Tax=Sedimentibacter acidaminivorans TaxID=913099 RepID=A0ABS4GAC2_9FIRM|nr:hypothetical protein [Sedimentibacter acidaminivorans]MBP1924634.1 hypothetical protein [Sedimentibacter acidaminivorans]
MADIKERALIDTSEIYIDFKDMTDEQKLKFQGFYLAMQMLLTSEKENTTEKETA